MTRFWAITVLALAASVGLSQDPGVQLKEKVQVKEKEKEKEKVKEKEKEKDLEFKGKFKDDDLRDAQRNGPSQSYVVKMKAGKAYTIDMVSSELDSYLRLLDPKGTQLDEDDDSGGNLNSRIIFNCTKDGDYKIVCTTFAANMNNGNYVLTVKTAVNNQKPSTSHAVLVGKEAPDFTGDFAVNGSPVKLADLKGKVVLLSFWEVRSTPSAALLPVLAEWNKTYKADGLAIVGVTYYTSEIGQKLAFDKESGKIKDIRQADVKSDQTLLTNFAAHHKIDYLLMALPRIEARTAFDAYAVNGLPQIVLIDRKGMVRLFHVGGVKNNTDVENEIKKLIAEK